MPEGSPINDILQMRQQGLSNNQIIQNLQRQGYSNTQVFDAMNQADTKMAVEGVAQPGLQPTPNNSPAQDPGMFTQPPPEIEEPVSQSFSEPQQSINLESPAPTSFSDEVKVEELVETIIEEKWTELVRDVNKIVDWKNKVENRLAEIEMKLSHLKENFTDLNTAVVGKVNDYDKHILEVGSNIKAMEKAFSKVLPQFTENIHELDRITDKLKKGE